MLAVGDIAPDFELKNYNGKAFKLSSFKNKKPVVVFFYPADSTPGCTTEVNMISYHS
jgi:peroxiredoxin Q/BCP